MIEEFLSNIDTTSLIGKVVFLVIVAVFASVLQRIVVRISRRALEAAKVPQASILLNILRVIIWSFSLLLVLQPVFGIEPTGFIAAIGVTSVALSLGMQDTMANIVGGLSLMLSRVIVPGDVITVGGFTGKVNDINWRSTVVEARGGNIEVIPNSVLSKSSFTKLTEGAAAASSLTFVVRHDADLEEVADEVATLATQALGELADPERTPVIQFGGMDAYGITMTVVTFITPEAMPAAANDRVSRAVAGRPWLAQIISSETRSQD